MKKTFLILGFVASFLLLVLTNIVGIISDLTNSRDVYWGAFLGLALGAYIMWFCYSQLKVKPATKNKKQ
jgi:hypothetical protein